MKQDRVSGIAIIAGSVMAVLTMALHPLGGHPRTNIDYLTRAAPVAFWVHVLALAAVAVQVFGFLGLHRALDPGLARVRAGLVAFAIAWVAVFGAALASGVLTLDMVMEYPDLDAAEQAAMHVLWDYNRTINRALDKVWIVGTCVGTLLWSLVLWPRRGWRAASVLGLIVAALGLLALGTGRLRLNVTGVGLFVLGCAVWAVTVGLLLCRRSTDG